MRKAMVYILALTLAFSALLAGCGENSSDRNSTRETQKPQTSSTPETMMPDPEDGVVKDRDGIITDGDTGGVLDDNILTDGNGTGNGNGGMMNGSGQASGSGSGNGASVGNGGDSGTSGAGSMNGTGTAAMP